MAQKRIYASKKGYVGVNGAYEEPYDGRYGKGKILHKPSKEGFYSNKRGCWVHSNEYHQVVYIVEV